MIVSNGWVYNGIISMQIQAIVFYPWPFENEKEVSSEWLETNIQENNYVLMVPK